MKAIYSKRKPPEAVFRICSIQIFKKIYKMRIRIREEFISKLYLGIIIVWGCLDFMKIQLIELYSSWLMLMIWLLYNLLVQTYEKPSYASDDFIIMIYLGWTGFTTVWKVRLFPCLRPNSKTDKGFSGYRTDIRELFFIPSSPIW